MNRTVSARGRRIGSAWWAVAGVLVLLVAACGGVGTGGTGSFASGPITGFGSIIVDGVRFDETSALIEDDADQPRDRDALRLGTVVEVDSGAVRDGEAAASRVRIVSVLIGRVEATATDALVVNGLNVRLNANTAIDDRFVGGVAGIAVGRVVEVHGFAMGGSAGELLATRVEGADAAAAFKIRGVVWALDQAARTFRIGTQLFAYPAQVSGRNELREGAFVRVLTATARDAQGRWPVTLIAGVAPPADRAEARAEGVINAYASAASFEVGGLTVDASAASIEGGPLAAGLRVEVEGAVQAGVLVARKVEVKDEDGDDEIEMRGVIATVDPVARTFSFNGRREPVSFAAADIVFENGSVTDLAPGRRVLAVGTLSADGTRLDARRIRFEN